MQLSVYNREGNRTKRSVELDEILFGIEPNDHVIWLDVRAIQAHGRQGTHKTKERGEVSKSGRKLYRQKGTGNARAGDARSPLRKGGGTIFGPKPHEYRLGVNRKTRQLARRSALVHKLRAENIRVVEDITLEVPKTSELAAMLQALELANRKVLLLTQVGNETLYKSGRNIPKLSVCPAGQASTLDIMEAQIVLVEEGAFDALTNALRPSSKATVLDAEVADAA